MAESSQGSSPAEADELLAHRRFLRLLANSLVRDEHRAEDLVQDTWLRALERPPEASKQSLESRSLRGWLGRVLKNRAINEGQREAQRAERERDAGSASAAPDFDEVEAELDVQRQVVESLRGLREPYRTTLYLRYYRELGPSKIAELQGLPLKTVKTRLTRGLEELRQCMDRKSHGDRGAWATLLLPLVRGGELPWQPMATPLGLAQQGSAALLAKLALGAVVVATLGVGLRLFGAGDALTRPRGGPLPSTLPALDAAEDARLVRGAQAELGVSRDALQSFPAPHSAAPGQRASLRGRLVDYSGSPLGSAVLTLRALSTNASAVDFAMQTAESDAQGYFELNSPWIGVLALEAHASGFASLQRLELGLGRDQELGDIALDRGLLLCGRILDEYGLPVPGARVEARANRGRSGAWQAEAMGQAFSDAGGRFVLPGQPIGPWELGITAEGYLLHEARGISSEFPGAGQQTLVGDFELESAELLSGRVGRLPAELDNIEGMASLRVRARAVSQEELGAAALELEQAQAVLEDGSFSIGGLTPGEDYALTLLAVEGERLAFLGVGRAHAGERDCLLDWNGAELAWRSKSRRPVPQDPSSASGVLEVSVRGAAGEALVGALIARQAIGRGATPGEEFRVSDSSGSVRWEGLAPGEQRLRIMRPGAPFLRAPGMGVAEPQATATVLAQGLTKLELRAEALGSLAGSVQQDGLALCGAQVFLRRVGAPGELRVARSDSWGRFECAQLAAGQYTLRIQHPSRSLDSSFELSLAAHSQEQIFEIYSASLSGRVLDRAGSPLEGVRLEPRLVGTEALRSPRGKGIQAASVLSDAEGYFELVGLEPGRTLLLEARALDLSCGRSELLQLLAGEERRGLELVLAPGASVQVELKSAAGEPSSARKSRMSYVLRAHPIDSNSATPAFESAVMRGPSLGLSGLPAGGYWLQVFALGRGESRALGERKRVSLEAGAEIQLDIQL